MLQEGLAHHQAGRLKEAEALYRAALAADPGNADALHLLGFAAHQQGRHEEAAGLIGRALAIVPAFGAAHGNLGHVLLALKRYEEAAASYLRAEELAPGNAGVLVNLAYALIELGRLEDAAQRARETLALRPDDAEAHQFLGIALAGLERFDEAALSYRRALALKPDYREAHVNLGQLCLLRGDYAEGWRHYAWRRPRNDANEWTGAQDLKGKSILLRYEQGLGDTIHFVRYAPLVAVRGAKVYLQVPAVLAPFMQGFGEIVPEGTPAPRTDYACSLLDLPHALGTTADAIPAPIPYLRADPGDWRAKLGAGREKLVGLCWRGNPQYPGDRHRSMRLDALAPLLSLPGVRFVSLQRDLHPVERVPNLIHPGADFAGTAGLVAALDLVISVDTVWAHWAGAIGKPLWLLLSRIPHWCWMMERADSPWYPNATLYRQSKGGDWTAPVGQIARALAKLDS